MPGAESRARRVRDSRRRSAAARSGGRFRAPPAHAPRTPQRGSVPTSAGTQAPGSFCFRRRSSKARVLSAPCWLLGVLRMPPVTLRHARHGLLRSLLVLLALCASRCAGMMAGGFSAETPLTAESTGRTKTYGHTGERLAQALSLRGEAEAVSGRKFTLWEPLSVRTQVVAGINYDYKVRPYALRCAVGVCCAHCVVAQVRVSADEVRCVKPRRSSAGAARRRHVESCARNSLPCRARPPALLPTAPTAGCCRARLPAAAVHGAALGSHRCDACPFIARPAIVFAA